MQNAINKYLDARSAHIEAKNAERAALDAFRSAKQNDPESLISLSEKHDATCFAEVRAMRIKKAAAYIAERRIKEAAVPVVENLLRKYAGKSAGPKTSAKFCAEIAEESATVQAFTCTALAMAARLSMSTSAFLPYLSMN